MVVSRCSCHLPLRVSPLPAAAVSAIERAAPVAATVAAPAPRAATLVAWSGIGLGYG
jgi:hypothetical protein